MLCFSTAVGGGVLASRCHLFRFKFELLQGWRIPFLITIITTPIAVIMRMHM
jgi:hypothetical protein